MVDGVVEAPSGAHFTACAPDYGRDEAFQKRVRRAAAIAEAWDEFQRQVPRRRPRPSTRRRSRRSAA